ncbi:6-pyruvoyl trahydropterin synthase family protein [Mesorhizobium mediterraneum]|uniref:6-pyruvoyl trahydropterin synthase family protein n=1 Tax=Mesorhizobium mediterraneum TaxID=43617 RepID=UPI0017818708|nr:6-carboxytetrahydropterin synthase [Mesorhizobium mediterraneum]
MNELVLGRTAPLQPPQRGREIYRSTKSYDHAEGLSCCFRQWKAFDSHCRFIHGYSLAFRFVFATYQLDERNWCFDFGALRPVKEWLKSMFDHTALVAEDDPALSHFEQLHHDGLLDLRVMPAVGCEATAKYVFEYVEQFLRQTTGERVWLESVEVKEHGGNSAIYCR